MNGSYAAIVMGCIVLVQLHADKERFVTAAVFVVMAIFGLAAWAGWWF